MTHERQTAKEIRDEYVETMSKIYYSYFKGYLTRLTKLQVLCVHVCGLVAMTTAQLLAALFTRT